MKAALGFREAVRTLDRTPDFSKAAIDVYLYGSLSLTGEGHGTHKAVLGGSKNNIQKVFAIAAVVGVIATVGVMFLLKDQIMNTEGMAPQASLMAAISEGILSYNLPWTIIFIGVFMSVVLQFLGLPIRRLYFKIPEVSKIELDKFSSFVFLQINGERNIYEIGQILKNEYVEEIEPLYERLIIFLEFLKNQKDWITYKSN
jgi:hypothetical protein